MIIPISAHSYNCCCLEYGLKLLGIILVHIFGAGVHIPHVGKAFWWLGPYSRAINWAFWCLSTHLGKWVSISGSGLAFGHDSKYFEYAGGGVFGALVRII